MVHLLLSHGADFDDTFDLMCTTAWDNEGIIYDEIAHIIRGVDTLLAS